MKIVEKKLNLILGPAIPVYRYTAIPGIVDGSHSDLDTAGVKTKSSIFADRLKVLRTFRNTRTVNELLRQTLASYSLSV